MEISNCPHCHSKNVEVIGRDYGWVECLTCSATGPAIKTDKQSAIDSWNSRPDLEEIKRLKTAMAGVEKHLKEIVQISSNVDPYDSYGMFSCLNQIDVLVSDIIYIINETNHED